MNRIHRHIDRDGSGDDDADDGFDRVRMDVEVTVRPASDGDRDDPQPIPLPFDEKTLYGAEEAVLAWLDERREHRALFALDHERALATAAPDVFGEEGTNGRRRRGVDPSALGPFPTVAVESLDVSVDREEC